MAIHIKDLNINTFRGIKNLKIEDFGDINIITGDNNSGKTSVLEIIQTLSSPCELRRWISFGGRITPNSNTMYEKFELLFNIDNENKHIEYSITDYEDKKEVVKIEAKHEILELSYEEIEAIEEFSLMMLADEIYDDDSDDEDIDIDVDRREIKTVEVSKYDIEFRLNNEVINTDFLYDFQRRIYRTKKIYPSIKKVVYVSPVQHSQSRVYLREILNQPELYEEILKILKLFDSGIISINADKPSNKFGSGTVYKILSKNHKTAIPLNFYGDGIKKAVLLISAVIAAKDGILLLDEFEIAIHTSAMSEIFAWIIETCISLNVQLFMTSHSEEAIDKVLKCSPKNQSKIRQITLYSNEDETVARVLTGEKAIKLKDNLGVELR